MKKFIIEIGTNWCGEDEEYAALAEKESDLWDIAEQYAYDNFAAFGGFETLLEEEFGYKEEYSEEEMDEISLIEGEYYSFSIKEVIDEEDEDRWEMYKTHHDFIIEP